MNKLFLIILVSFFLIPVRSVAYVSDTLNIDSVRKVSVNYLPPDFREKYSGDEFVYEQELKPSIFQRFIQWLARMLAKIFNFEATQRSFEIVEIVIKVLIFVAIGLMIFFIVRALMKNEGYWVFAKKPDSAAIKATDVETNVLETNFDELIKNAVRDKNFNLAVRYYYLKSLKILSEKSIISWDAEKTNSDYYFEIQNEKLKEQFNYVSYIYNYCWYGEFDLNSTAWEHAENTFLTFIKSIK
ncbi:MAG: hypothetical protein PHE56_06520 [Bacteroidales bacterium]|nr:hypothetical protein [Bacteroidales bacterium]